jgi:HemY protein
LRGLYLEAKRLGADEAARQYAEKAAEKAPQLTWAADATIEHLTKHGLFDDAIRLLEQSRLAGAIEKKAADRRKAVLLTARAAAKLEADPKGARDDAQMALRLDETLIPASLTAAKALFREDNLRRGAAVLETAWKNQTHPDIAKVYIRARSGDSAVDRLKRAERLDALKPNNADGLSALAKALLDAKDYSGARAKAEAAVRMNPCQSAFLLLADVEEAETGDQGRIRHWLSMARNAPLDAAWVADGYVSDTWLPVSPVTGKLDAFEWKVPVTALAGLIVDGTVTTVDDAFLSLPPVAPKPVDIVVTAPPTQTTINVPVEPAPVAQTVAAKPTEKKPEPFFGHAPDDPGVRQGSTAAVEKKSRMRLF